MLLERRQHLCLRKKQQKQTNIYKIHPFDGNLTSDSFFREIKDFIRLSPQFVVNNIMHSNPIARCSNYIAILSPQIRPYILRNVGVQQVLITSLKVTRNVFTKARTAFETHSLDPCNYERNFLFQYSRIRSAPPTDP